MGKISISELLLEGSRTSQARVMASDCLLLICMASGAKIHPEIIAKLAELENSIDQEDYYYDPGYSDTIDGQANALEGTWQLENMACEYEEPDYQITALGLARLCKAAQWLRLYLGEEFYINHLFPIINQI